MDKLPEIEIKPGIPLVAQLAEGMRGYIVRDCKPGQKILSERKLSEALGCSRVTTGRVVAALAREGLLYQAQGSGTYVAERKKEGKRKIAVVVYHSDNPFYGKIVRAVQEEVDGAGFHTILVNSKGDVRVEDAALGELRTEVDGFIVAPALDPEGKLAPGLTDLVKQDFPLVLICHTPAGGGASGINTVVPDFHSGGHAITSHLLDAGYRKVLFFAISGLFHRQDIHDRFEGYRQALAERQVAFDESWLVKVDGFDDFNGFFDDGRKAVDKIIPLIEKGTAVFSLGDSSAIGLLRGLRERGLSVPGDVGVCGFDDIALASQWGIELTTVRIPASSIGREATRIVLANIQSPGLAKVENIVCPVELVVRETT